MRRLNSGYDVYKAKYFLKLLKGTTFFKLENIQLAKCAWEAYFEGQLVRFVCICIFWMQMRMIHTYTLFSTGSTICIAE